MDIIVNSSFSTIRVSCTTYLNFGDSLDLFEIVSFAFADVACGAADGKHIRTKTAHIWAR